MIEMMNKVTNAFEEFEAAYTQEWWYKIIEEAYRDRKALRSGRPYVNHIDEGIYILKYLPVVDMEAIPAFALHPIFQCDEYEHLREKVKAQASARIIQLCEEYARTANAFLPKHYIDFPNRPKINISAIKAVNDMLIADKIQNFKDLMLYNKNHPDYKKLVKYFTYWLSNLGFPYKDLNLTLTMLKYNIYRKQNKE